MRKTALIPAAVLAAGIVCASPAHAGVGDWTGKMALGNQANPNYTIPVEIHRKSDGHLQMSASNGCVEDWHIPAPGSVDNSTNIQGGTFTSGFMDVTVESGGAFGCTSARQASVGVRVQGAHRTMTARTQDAAWLMYGDW
jgi:hypothetical protein